MRARRAPRARRTAYWSKENTEPISGIFLRPVDDLDGALGRCWAMRCGRCVSDTDRFTSVARVRCGGDSATGNGAGVTMGLGTCASRSRPASAGTAGIGRAVWSSGGNAITRGTRGCVRSAKGCISVIRRGCSTVDVATDAWRGACGAPVGGLAERSVLAMNPAPVHATMMGREMESGTRRLKREKGFI